MSMVRIALAALLAWASPASAVCEFLCAPGQAHGGSHHGGAEADHHAEHHSPEGHSHTEGCCCIAAQLAAKKVDLVDVSPKLVVLPVARVSESVLQHGEATMCRHGGPPGLPLSPFSQRNQPLLN